MKNEQLELKFEPRTGSKLYDETLVLLRNRPASITLKDIINGCETRISIGWLQSFARETMKNPSVVKTEQINNFLQKRIREINEGLNV